MIEGLFFLCGFRDIYLFQNSSTVFFVIRVVSFSVFALWTSRVRYCFAVSLSLFFVDLGLSFQKEHLQNSSNSLESSKKSMKYFKTRTAERSLTRQVGIIKFEMYAYCTGGHGIRQPEYIHSGLPHLVFATMHASHLDNTNVVSVYFPRPLYYYWQAWDWATFSILKKVAWG